MGNSQEVFLKGGLAPCSFLPATWNIDVKAKIQVAIWDHEIEGGWQSNKWMEYVHF